MPEILSYQQILDRISTIKQKASLVNEKKKKKINKIFSHHFLINFFVHGIKTHHVFSNEQVNLTHNPSCANECYTFVRSRRLVSMKIMKEE